jgi:type I restriction enzyme M protein
MKAAPIVSKVWSFCTTLRDDGVSYGDYLEQLTYLIFLGLRGFMWVDIGISG